MPRGPLPKDPHTADDIRALMAACSRKAPTGIRNRALIALLAGSGLRISEALALRPGHLDLEAMTVTVERGKGGRPRVARLLADTAEPIAAWLRERKALGLNGRQAVFCTLEGEPVKAAYIRALLPRLAKKANIEKRIHAHGFRHAYAVTLLGAGVSVHAISLALGHANLEVTSAYLARIAPAEATAAIAGVTLGLE